MQSGATEKFPGRVSEINFEEWLGGGVILIKMYMGVEIRKSYSRQREEQKQRYKVTKVFGGKLKYLSHYGPG